MKMPEPITKFYHNAPESCNIEQMITSGELNRGAVMAAVRRVLLMMGHFE